MKINKNLFLLTLLGILLFTGCKKDSSITQNKESSQNAKVGSLSTDNMVPTPGGLRLRSTVHLVEAGFHISVSEGHVLKIHDQTGKVMEDYGKADEALSNSQNLNGSKIRSLNNYPSNAPTGGNPNWQTFTQWNSASGKTITGISTTWTVPSAPVGRDNQVIYLFNGLGEQDQSDIMQPVLQWGYNTVFGGNYWLLSNWYVWASGAAYTNTISPITPGTSLTGIISYTGVTGSSYNYTSSFSGYSNSMVINKGNSYNNFNASGTTAIPQIYPQTWAYETLEVYHLVNGNTVPEVVQPSDYPADMDVIMKNISLQTNSSPASLLWASEIGSYATLGEHSNIISNNATGTGEVDIYFHPQPPAISYTTPTGFSVNNPGTLVPTNGGGAATYSVSPNLPPGLTINTSTGTISGTPSSISAAKNYVVKATNYSGSSSFTVTIQVYPAPVLTVSYGGHDAIINFSVTPNIPSPVTGNLFWKDLTNGQSGQSAGSPTGGSSSWTDGHSYQFYYLEYGTGSPGTAQSNTVNYTNP